jgi:hypothetical protein
MDSVLLCQMHPNENRDLASRTDARYRERKRGGENPFSTSLFAGANRRDCLARGEQTSRERSSLRPSGASSIIDFGTHLRLATYWAMEGGFCYGFPS